MITNETLNVFLSWMAVSRYEDVVWKEFTGQDCVSTMSIFEQAEKEGTALVTLNEMNY